MLVGYSRISTADQDPEYQIRALEARGCERIYTDRCPSRCKTRPQLDAAFEFLREGDSFVVWKFDRLARSVPHLLELAAKLERRQCRRAPLGPQVDLPRPSDRAGSESAAPRQRRVGRGGGAPARRSSRDAAALVPRRRPGRVPGAERREGVTLADAFKAY
jgi:hypothetical protein